MKGSIRILVGLLIVFGAVGGIETESSTLLEGTIAALIGIAIMAWGTEAAKKEENL